MRRCRLGSGRCEGLWSLGSICARCEFLAGRTFLLYLLVRAFEQILDERVVICDIVHILLGCRHCGSFRLRGAGILFRNHDERLLDILYIVVVIVHMVLLYGRFRCLLYLALALGFFNLTPPFLVCLVCAACLGAVKMRKDIIQIVRHLRIPPHSKSCLPRLHLRSHRYEPLKSNA